MNKQSFKYARILNVSGAMHSIRSLYTLLISNQGRGLLTMLSNIQDEAFHKKNNVWMQACNQKFSGMGGFVELGHFDKHFVKNNKVFFNFFSLKQKI